MGKLISITDEKIPIDPPGFDLGRYIALRYLHASEFHRVSSKVYSAPPDDPKREVLDIGLVEATDVEDSTVVYAGTGFGEVSIGDLTRLKFDNWMKRLESLAEGPHAP